MDHRVGRRLNVSGINFPKIALHVFVCDSEDYMEKLFGNLFLENLISIA